MLFNAEDWIRTNVAVTPGNSASLLYDAMEKQGGGKLLGIDVPWEPRDPTHCAEYARTLSQFLIPLGKPRRVLDIGPGDGWPSLLIAPFVGEVVGVDLSPRRVEVCAENARRREVLNARFVMGSATRLPFPDASFDAVVSSSTLDQCEDTEMALREVFRVLVPGGRIASQHELPYPDASRAHLGRRQDAWWLHLVRTQRKPGREFHIYVRFVPPTREDNEHCRRIANVLQGPERGGIYYEGADPSHPEVSAGLERYLTAAEPWITGAYAYNLVLREPPELKALYEKVGFRGIDQRESLPTACLRALFEAMRGRGLLPETVEGFRSLCLAAARIEIYEPAARGCIRATRP